MYTFSNKLKLTAIVLIIVGILGVAYGFFTAPKTVEDVKTMLVDAHHAHNQAVDVHHDDAHYEHVLHQLQNKPWAALYVAALFFLFISLGVLAFYAINRASQAGWSPVLFPCNGSHNSLLATWCSSGFCYFSAFGLTF
ncbi:exported hypothetical protein [Capnocytophaga canimorsus]|uniref:Uncharacterized protein n=1 Tax=Capnocytophaga canimorsus TaxID=28188 RepID=A0A0B7HC46_9FLAO|nr:exported hypothetical protein [Capnocytophaga canimorsus]